MTVDRIEPDDALMACATLDTVYHVDVHLLRTDARRSPRQWAREILENVSAMRQLSLRTGWTLLGIRLRHGDRDAVAGWSVAYEDAECIRLQSHSFTGLTGELVTRVTDEGVVFATFVRVDGALARFLWDRALTAHLTTVATLLAEAGERVS